jgi:hypothetical protein
MTAVTVPLTAPPPPLTDRFARCVYCRTWLRLPAPDADRVDAAAGTAVRVAARCARCGR